MAVIILYKTAGGDGRDWIEALVAYWGKLPDEEPPRKPTPIPPSKPSRNKKS